MPVDRVRELLPLLRSDVAEVRREALRQLVPLHADRGFRLWNRGLVPLDRNLARTLGDAVFDKDPEVARTARELLPDVVFRIGSPAEVVLRWAQREAPVAAFTQDAFAILAAADSRWPADALLERIAVELKQESPALPRDVLELGATILRTQSRAGDGVRRVRADLDVEREPQHEDERDSKRATEPSQLTPDLVARLRADDRDVHLRAMDELEQLATKSHFAGDCLPTLVDLALHGPEPVRVRVENLLFWGVLPGDPAPLLDLWRGRHAIDEYLAARALEAYGGIWGARSLPILETIAREGGPGDREQIARTLRLSSCELSRPPVGDALLKQLMEHPDAENQNVLLDALEKHPAVVKEVIPQLVAWLDGPYFHQPVEVLSLAGEKALRLQPDLLERIADRCARHDVGLARFAKELPRFGPAAAAPLSKAFDAAREPYERSALAQALLALDVRREKALGTLLALADDAAIYPATRAHAFAGFARFAPDDPRLLASCRRFVVAEDPELLDPAWRLLARHFGLEVDDEGIVRPG